MQVYLINMAVVLVLGLALRFFQNNENRKKFRLIFIAVSFGLMWFLAAFRLDTGNDYSIYINSFQQMADDGLSNFGYSGWEIGFVLLTKFIGFFTRNNVVFLAITSLLSLAGPAYLIWRHSRNPLISVMLYMNLFFYYLTLNFIRQAIAISIVCFAWDFFKTNKFWRFAAVIIVAALFHYSALIMLVIYFLVKFKPGIRTVLLYCYFLIFYFILADGLINIAITKLDFEYEVSLYTTGISMIYTLLPLLLCALFFVAYALMKDKIRLDVRYMISMSYLSLFWLIVITRQMFFESFLYYSYIFIILAVPEILATVKRWLPMKIAEMCMKKYTEPVPEEKRNELITSYCEKVGKKNTAIIVRGLSIGIVVISMAYNIYGLAIGGNGVHGVVPYSSIIGFLNF